LVGAHGGPWPSPRQKKFFLPTQMEKTGINFLLCFWGLFFLFRPLCLKTTGSPTPHPQKGGAHQGATHRGAWGEETLLLIPPWDWNGNTINKKRGFDQGPEETKTGPRGGGLTGVKSHRFFFFWENNHLFKQNPTPPTNSPRIK